MDDKKTEVGSLTYAAEDSRATEDTAGAVSVIDMTAKKAISEAERHADLRLTVGLFLLYLACLYLPALFSVLSPYAQVFRTLAYLLPITLFLLESKKKHIKIECLRLPTWGDFRATLPLLPLFLLSVSLMAALSALFFPEAGGAVATGPLWKDLLHHALIPALLEEGLLRFAVFSLLFRQFGESTVYLSAILFALLHTPASMPYALIGGIFLGTVLLLSHSLWMPILFHFLNNALSLLLSHLSAVGGEAVAAFVPFFFLIPAVMGTLSVIVLARHRRDLFYRPLAALLPVRGHGHRSALMRAVLSPLTPLALLLLLFALL